jgi:hypothetical protein
MPHRNTTALRADEFWPFLQAGRSAMERLVQDVQADEDEGCREDPVTVAGDGFRDPLLAGEEGTRQAPQRDAYREYHGDYDLGRPIVAKKGG